MISRHPQKINTEASSAEGKEGEHRQAHMSKEGKIGGTTPEAPSQRPKTPERLTLEAEEGSKRHQPTQPGPIQQPSSGPAQPAPMPNRRPPKVQSGQPKPAPLANPGPHQQP